jgi:hypothetical protein
MLGGGKGVTILEYTGTGNFFETEEDAEGIVLDSFTVKLSSTSSTGILINNAESLTFSDIRLQYGTSYWATSSDNLIGLKITGSGTGIKNNRYNGLEFAGLTYAVYTENNASHNNFNNCLLEDLHQGFSFGNLSTGGANYNTVTNSIFDRIREECLEVIKGHSNMSRGNIFKTVSGYNFNIIKFVTDGNTSENDIFERPRYLESDELYDDQPYVQEIGGVAYRQTMVPVKTTLASTLGDTRVAFRLPIGTASAYEIRYVYNSTEFNQTRKGTLHVTFDSATNQKELVDDYEYVGLDPAGETAIKFTVEFDTVPNKYIKIEYVNNNGTSLQLDENTFIYTYSVLS